MILNRHRKTAPALILGLSIGLSPSLTCASSSTPYSVTPTGFLGLNTVPNARMDEAGTVRTGLGTLDPYIHGFIGVQIAKPLYVNIRQTAEVSNLTEKADHLYPGVDLKLRLLEEGAYHPEIAIGLQSAFGHKRTAGEYVALSKRYKNFDFTFGLGWGRFGTAGHLDNPFKVISNHFRQDRDANDEIPNGASDWFTGDRIGFFGGVEYFLPVDGLSLKLDYGADRYSAEKSTTDYKPGTPWAVGINYTHKNWLSASIGTQGGDKVMGRLSLQSIPSRWPLKAASYDIPDKPFYKKRPERTNTNRIMDDTYNHGIHIDNIEVKETSLSADLHLPQATPTPQYLGRAVRNIAQNSSAEIEAFLLTLHHDGLKGTTIKIMRSDVEKAVNNSNSSPEEIWNNAEFIVTEDETTMRHVILPKLGIKMPPHLKMTFENQISYSEEDRGILYRSNLLADYKSATFYGLSTGAGLRVNITDNLSTLRKIRPAALLPVRSDIDAFTDKAIGLDRLYGSFAHSITPELHMALSAGYLEEFYAGFGGEVLYRPFDSRLAVGAEMWQAYRRDPDTTLNMGLYGTQVTSGHLNLWYDVPHHNMTAQLRGGRFLAGDTGGSLSLHKTFDNGARLSGHVALSNYADADVFGGTTHAYHSLNLTLPLGSLPYVPSGSTVNTRIAPFGRDTAQSLNKPVELFEVSEGFTLDHIARHWGDITK